MSLNRRNTFSNCCPFEGLFNLLLTIRLIFICQCQCILAPFKKLAQVCILTFSWLNPIFFWGRYVWIAWSGDFQDTIWNLVLVIGCPTVDRGTFCCSQQETGALGSFFSASEFAIAQWTWIFHSLTCHLENEWIRKHLCGGDWRLVVQILKLAFIDSVRTTLTFWSGGHYRGAVLVNGVWHHYDRLWERNSRVQWLKKCTGKPSTPSGFLLSHWLCIKKWPVSFDLLWV